jgi:hypothetical protein
MVLPGEPFFELLVETYDSGQHSGRHGPLHVRPVEGQDVDTSLVVECSKSMRTDYPLGTMFLVTAKYSDRMGGGQYLKAPHAWGFTVVTKEQARRFLANKRR